MPTLNIWIGGLWFDPCLVNVYILFSSSSDLSSGSSSGSASSTAAKIAAKDMDHVLGEMALLQARTEMYFKFFRKRAMVKFLLIFMQTQL